jgi:RNA polymerase sigma factor (sigma-70 family)
VTDSRNFDATVRPHLDAGYNLARWLMRDEAGAEDAVQEAALRAFKYFKGLRGDNARAWFLGIVRNVCFTHLEERSRRQEQTGLDEGELDALHWEMGAVSKGPDDSLQQRMDRVRIDAALRALPPILREVIVLRELEEMSYEDIGRVADIALGTVMSRLSRARARLKELLLRAGAGH